MFFSLDGVDGAGKSTQLRLFCEWLRERGLDVVACRDPGSTRLGEAIRGLLLDAHATPIGRRAEMLLYMAARAQLVEEVIAPALAAGKTVVSDRYLLANVVYQGHAGGVDVEHIREVGRVATAGVMPDLSFVLDLSQEAAAGRIERALDPMERQPEEFRQALRRGYLDEARRQPDRIFVIDAARPVDAVQADIRAAAGQLLECRAGAKAPGRTCGP
jgi:dTMP kinase